MKTCTVTDESALPAARMQERMAAAHAAAGRPERAAEAHEAAASEFIRAGQLADAVAAQAAARVLRGASVSSTAATGTTVATPEPSPLDGSDLSGQSLYAHRLCHPKAPAPKPASEPLTGHELYEHRLTHRAK